ALAAAELEHARAEAAVHAARAALAAEWGGAPGEVGELTGVLRVPTELPDQAALLARLDEHPRLALQRSQIESRRAALALEQSQAVPDVTVGGGLRFLRDGSDAGFVAGLSVPLPGRHQNQGNIRAARESLAGAELGLRAVEVDLRAAGSAAWQELAVAHRAARNLREQALPATADAYAAVRRAYEQGQLPLMDVLDAQRALVSVRRELVDAEAAYALAFARLVALGGASPEAVAQLLNPA
ncbi:MAG TPA: TolC family protein, partial [Opitutaceae bacterium]|nr:TolC family protein [Opitutaceae bacterium]